MKGFPGTVVTDLGSRSQANFRKTPAEIGSVFLGRSADVAEEMRDYCRRSRLATEGLIAVAKNLRGFGKSMWHRPKGHRMWSLLCQTAYNLKKFLRLYYKEEIKEKNLVRLGLV